MEFRQVLKPLIVRCTGKYEQANSKRKKWVPNHRKAAPQWEIDRGQFVLEVNDENRCYRDERLWQVVLGYWHMWFDSPIPAPHHSWNQQTN